MSPKRYQAYLDLANTLLACPRGREQAVLAGYPELIDAGFSQTLRHLAQERRHSGDVPEAQRLEELIAQLGDRPPSDTTPATEHFNAEAERLFQQGSERYQTSQFKSALKAWQQALLLYQDAGDTQGEARALSSLGMALQSLGQYQQAIEHYQQSLAMRREGCLHHGSAPNAAVADQANYAARHFALHHSQGEYYLAVKLAIDHFQKHLNLTRSIGDRLGAANSLVNLAKAYSSLGQYQQAQTHYEAACALQEQIGDRAGQARSLLGLAQVCDQLERYETAASHYQRYLSLPETNDLNQSSSLALALVGLAHAHYHLGHYERALSDYQRAQVAADQAGDRQQLAAAWSGLGNTHYSLGNAVDALAAYERALALKRELGDRFGTAIQLSNLSQVYNTLGKEDCARQLQQQALALKRDLSALNEAG